MEEKISYQSGNSFKQCLNIFLKRKYNNLKITILELQYLRIKPTIMYLKNTDKIKMLNVKKSLKK